MRRILLIALLAISQINLQAQCMLSPVLLNQRVTQSSTVVEGKVVSQQSFWDPNHQNIYTSSLIEVYKSFKNTSPEYIEIITEGGTVGNDKEVVEPSLELAIGDIGVFTLNQNSLPNQFGKQVYEAYAGPQGYIKYNVEENVATEPFRKYTNLSTTLYNEIQQYTQENYTVIRNTNPFGNSDAANRTGNVAATLTSFSPTTITAGTFSVLTINGTGFGATQGTSFVEFKRADDGGTTFCRPDASSYVSWSDTQIQVKVTTTGASTVNSTPGTGVIRVDIGGVKTTSTATLTIPHAQMNVYSNGAAPFTIYNTRHVNKQSGGYVWQMYTGFDSNASAKASFLRAFQSWRCGTYINWTSGTTTTVNVVANDGVNIIRFDISTELPSGVLGRCTSRWSGCGTNPSQSWFVNELDIVFDDVTNWNYGPAAPGFSQYDFESVAVHELGHGHQLGHVINSAEIMNYSISNGQQKRTLSVNDLSGGNAVMARNLSGGVCSNTAMTALTASNCAIGAPSASFTANRTTVCPGQTVVFTDASVGNPTSWSWFFAGGTPSTSAVQNPTITYNTPGTYSVALTASNTAGSNTYSVAAYITVTSAASLPLVESFQGTFPPTNWSVIDAGNDGVKWALSTSAGQASTQSALFDNFNTDVTGTKDELKTVVNLSGFNTAKMTFYRAYGATFGTPNIDSLEIRVSTDCGNTSNQAYYKGGSQIGTGAGNGSTIFIPTAAQWAKDSIDLTSYVGQSSVMISLINRSHYGDGMYLDNINITGTTASAPNATINSVSSACTGQAITFSCTTTGSPTSYSWSAVGGTPSSASTQTTSVTYSAGGVYTVSLTVANATGTTTTTKSITITATPTVVPSFSTTAICLGSSTTLSLTGATSYTWLPTGTGSVSVLSPTSTTVYSITGNTSGCNSSVKNVTVTVNGLPTTTASTSGTLTCSTLSVGLNSTLAGMAYTWSAPATGGVTNASTQNTGATGPGTYTLTVVNPTTTCSYSTTTSVTQNTTAPSVTGTSTGTLTCLTLTASVRATTTVTPVSYTWTGAGITSGNGTGTITVNQPGSYNYTVTNTSNGCKTTGTQAITQNTTMPTGVNAGANATLTCISPSVALNGSVSTPTNATVLWSGANVCGSTTSLSSAACAAGIYTLTATNPTNGCTATSTTQVFPNSGAPSVTASATSSINCSSLTTQVVATTTSSPVTYSWSGPGITSGTTTASATVNAGGTYTVVVTNTISGCLTITSTSVLQNTTAPSVTGSSTGTLTCLTLTASVRATTSVTPVSYTWTGSGIISGNGTGTITVNQGGSYNYTVTNTSNGCKTTGTQAITQNTTTPTGVSAGSNASLTCISSSVALNGSVSTPTNATVLWSGTNVCGSTSSLSSAACAAGIYTLTATNPANGCTATSTTQVSPSAGAPSVIATTTGSLNCSNLTTQVVATTTASPVSYSWSGPGIVSGASTASATVNKGGTYSVLVTNTVSGCSTTSTTSVIQNTVAPFVTASNTGSLSCITTTTSVRATTTITPVSYTWTGTGIVTGNGTGTITVNQGGSYNYTVINTSNGCQTTGTQAIVQNTIAPVVNGTVNGTLTCTTLTVTANATTTNSPINYNWTGTGIVSGATTGTITANQPGSYNYTVTNTSNGCQATGTRVVTQNTVIPTGVSAGSNATLSCASPSVALNGSVSTPTNATVLWSGASICGSSTSLTSAACATGIYTLTATNPANGCVATSTTQVFTSAGAPSVIASTTGTLNCMNPSVQVVATTTSSPVTYSWSGPGIVSGASTASTTVNTSGIYTVVVTNTTSGCSSIATTAVTQNTTMPIVTGAVNGTLTCTTSTITANATTTSSPVNYNWTGTGIVSGATTGTITVNQPGSYNYTVTNTSNGCQATGTRVVSQNIVVPSMTLSPLTSSICSGSSKILSVNTSSTNSISWSTGATTTSISVTPTNTANYTVTVTNAVNGCTISGVATVSVVANPTVIATATNVTCNSACDGIINASATGGSGFAYNLNGSATSIPSANLCAGNYTVMATNSNGCSNSTTVQITQPSALSTSVSITNPTCFGMCNGASTITTIGGTAPYTYSLGQGLPVCQATTCNSLCAGNYTIVVNDSKGCSTISTITILEPSELLASVSNTAATCSSCSDGSAQATVFGGTPGYTYMWSPAGGNAATAINLMPGCYTVTVTDTKNCQSMASTCVGFSTGINELLAGNHLSLFPNPSKGIVTINSNVAIEKMNISVINTIGQVVLNETALNSTQTTIDLSIMSKGIYYVKVSTEVGNKQFKVILE